MVPVNELRFGREFRLPSFVFSDPEARLTNVFGTPAKDGSMGRHPFVPSLLACDQFLGG